MPCRNCGKEWFPPEEVWLVYDCFMNHINDMPKHVQKRVLRSMTALGFCIH